MKTIMSQQEFERELLASARVDRVPEGARERVAGRLGLLGAAAPRGASDDGSAASGAALVKPALFGVTGVGVLGLALWAVLPSAAVSTEVPVPIAVPDVTALAATSAAMEQAVAAPSIVERPAPIAASLESEPTRSPSPVRAVRPKIKPAASGPVAIAQTSAGARAGSSEGLFEEVKQLDRARADLATERASLALAVLDDYERRFPEGQLALEASVLRASTLAANGRSNEARTLAQRLLARSDSARYRAELTRVLAR